MGKAFQCDRCHYFDAGDPVLQVTIKTMDPPVKSSDYQLCPECLASLHDWLKIGESDNNQGGHDDGVSAA